MKVGYLYLVACLLLPGDLFSFNIPNNVSWKELLNPLACTIQSDAVSGHDSQMPTMINNSLKIGVVKGCWAVLIGAGALYASRHFYDHRYVIYGIGGFLMAPSVKCCISAFS